MIKINGDLFDIGNFPDGSMLIKYNPRKHRGDAFIKLSWYYEDDRECMAIMYLVKHFRAQGIRNVYLYMPYIPNARQDRVKGPEDVFTLKYFAEFLNSLNFNQIEVLDPHSNVSEALINNLIVNSPKGYIEETLSSLKRNDGVDTDHLFVFYPDTGAAKRYADIINRYYVYGIKKRDWETGKIIGLDVIDNGFDIAGKDILIVDDICSRGGTFLHAAKKLKELGAKDIYLYVSHCENTILEGELLNGDLIKKVYTTNSIFTKEHEKIEVLK